MGWMCSRSSPRTERLYEWIIRKALGIVDD
jgi:hypothetical protein